MKLNDILNYTKFYDAIKNEKMSVTLAYRLSKLNSKVEQERKFYEEKVRDLIDKYADKDEKGQPIVNEQGGIKLRSETQAECMAQFNELENLEVDFDFKPFSIEEVEAFEVTVDEFSAIAPFIKE